VPGLLGRQCVDILLAVAEPDAEEDYRGELEALGFALRVREPDRRVFASTPTPRACRQCPARLFVCRSGGTWEFDQLLLTHYLGAHEERRQAYADLKRHLAKVHRDDPDGYARPSALPARDGAPGPPLVPGPGFLRDRSRITRPGAGFPFGAHDTR
jgi:GrpB-like predicted nucleotidyltransferase (UPF0157 family)